MISSSWVSSFLWLLKTSITVSCGQKCLLAAGNTTDENWLKKKQKRRALTLITDHRSPAADQVDQYESLETVHRRSEDIYCKCTFWFECLRRRVTFMWVFQVHDHEGVLACGAITEADLQTAGRRSRPGFINDLHRCESLPAQLLLIDNMETSGCFRSTLDRCNSPKLENTDTYSDFIFCNVTYLWVKQNIWMEFSHKWDLNQFL